MDAELAFDLVSSELYLAIKTFRPFHSAHEGLAIIWEEFEELKDEVFLKERSLEAMQREAVQVAAMAIRFLTDVAE